VVRRLIPREARSLANGIFHSGVSIGAAATPLLVLAMVGSQGEHWRLLFQVVGAAGLVWVVLWFWCLRGGRAAEVDAPAASDEGADQPESAPTASTPFWHVFLLRQFWIVLAISIAVNVFWHFYRVWLPRLLDRDLGLSSAQLQLVLIGFYLAADLGALTAGYVTRRLTARGFSVERSRQTVLIGTSLLCLLSVPAAWSGNPWIMLPLIFVGAAGSMGGFPNLFALVQDVSPHHTARIVGLIGAVAWYLLAVMHPWVGWGVDQIGTFVPFLIAVGFVPLLGSLTSLFWPGRARPEEHAANR
jgi:ACS family hexuronate transporter-like MFS transporter